MRIIEPEDGRLVVQLKDHLRYEGKGRLAGLVMNLITKTAMMHWLFDMPEGYALRHRLDGRWSYGKIGGFDLADSASLQHMLSDMAKEGKKES